MSQEEYLYHYTNAHAILNIVRTRKFWATQSGFLNDGLEGKLIEEVIESMAKCPSVWNLDLEEKIVQAAIEHLKCGHIFYVASFSRRLDTLAQYRMYCPPTGGYVLGFPRSYLASVGNLVDVEYGRKTQWKWCRDYLASFAEAAKAIDSPDLSARELAAALSAQPQWSKSRSQKSIRCKADEFSAEEEVRLLDIGLDPPSVRAVANGSLFLPYVELDLPNEPIVVHIANGPSKFPELANHGMHHLSYVARQAGTLWKFGVPGRERSSFRDLSG